MRYITYGYYALRRAVRRPLAAVVLLLALPCALAATTTATAPVSASVAVSATEPLEPIYLYSSPVTAAFFTANKTNYDTLKARWREYLRTFYGKAYREVNRPALLAGLKPGVLVLGSAALLDEQERKSIQAFVKSGGSVLATWGTGVRDGRGHWTGFEFVEDLFKMKVTGRVDEPDQRFLNTFGDQPLTWGVPSGQRIYLGDIAETPLRVDSQFLAARYFDWQRFPSPKNTNGAIAYLEEAGSRRVYFGFSESSWEYDANLKLPEMLDSTIAWLRRETHIYKATWPDFAESAQLLEMDSEDQYPNALNFAAELDSANIRGTFYSLTSIALQHADIVRQLAKKHEIGYHAEVHVGFKGKDAASQKERLEVMVSQMKNIVGSRNLPTVTGFRAPTESWDATTEQLLRKIGIRHHVSSPASAEVRVPVFSRSEPALGSEDAIVILPRTQMDDLNYQGMKLSTEKASELLALDFDYLHEAGALGVLSVHSQNYAVDGLMAKLTPAYIKRLQEHREDVWSASGAEIETWWRARERVVQFPLKSERNKLIFEVRAPGNVKGVKFYVSHPSAEMAPKSITALRPDLPTPELKRVDALRSAIVFRQALTTGKYEYALSF